MTTEIKYAWLDEDEDQVSPTHGKLSTALSFLQNWPSIKKTNELRTRVEVKDPVKLVRVVVTREIAELTDDETRLVELYRESES